MSRRNDGEREDRQRALHGEYLRLDLKAEVGVQIAQLHLVVQQHRVVAVLRRVRSLGKAQDKEAGNQQCLS